MNALERYFDTTDDTPSALADRIGRSASTITRVLKGERRASPELALQISRATNDLVAPSDVLMIAVERLLASHAEGANPVHSSPSSLEESTTASGASVPEAALSSST